MRQQQLEQALVTLRDVYRKERAAWEAYVIAENSDALGKSPAIEQAHHAWKDAAMTRRVMENAIYERDTHNVFND